MSRYVESCPFESRGRAGQCESCTSKSGLPPCVTAYLRGAESLVATNVVPLHRVIALSARKAA